MSRSQNVLDIQSSSPLKQFAHLDNSILMSTGAYKYSQGGFSDDDGGPYVSDDNDDDDNEAPNSLTAADIRHRQQQNQQQRQRYQQNGNTLAYEEDIAHQSIDYSQLNSVPLAYYYDSSSTITHASTNDVGQEKITRRLSQGAKWSPEEDERLKEIVLTHNGKNWKKIASMLGNTRTDVQCLHRWNKVLKPGLHKGAWSKEEDDVVKGMVLKHGVGKVKWSEIAAKLPGRIGKQCRERWFNHLDPTISKKEWTEAEDRLLYEAQKQHGNKWHDIAKMINGRTENAVKNRWNSSAMKKWLQENVHTNNQPAVAVNTHHNSHQNIAYNQPEYNQHHQMVESHSNHGNINTSNSQSNLSLSSNLSIDTNCSVHEHPYKKLRTDNGLHLSSLQSLSNNEPCYPIEPQNAIPDFLRPPKIVTSSSSLPANPNYHGASQDAITSHILSILTEMKASPVNRPGDLNPVNAHANKDNSVVMNNNNNNLNNSNSSSYDRRKSVAFDESDTTAMEHLDDSSEEVSVDSPNLNKNAMLMARSPTSEALARFRKELENMPKKASRKSKYPNNDLDDEDLILLLPHFLHLNEDTQRHIMQQLLSKFNSSSFTPRNYCALGTPMYRPNDVMNGRGVDSDANSVASNYDLGGLGSPHRVLETIDPNCFEIQNVDGSSSPMRKPDTNNNRAISNNNVMSDMTQSSSKSNSSQQYKDKLSSYSKSGDLTVSAVVSVAYQIATGQISPELQKLLAEKKSV